MLPNEFQQYCRLVVNLYAKELIDYVRRSIGEPRALCTRIGACRPSEVKVENEDKALCTFCKFAVDLIRKLINESEEEVIRELIKECNKLEAPTDRICRAMVEVLGRDIIKYIKEYGGTPEEICRRFRLCRPTEIKQVNLNEIFQKEQPKVACTVCVLAVSQIQRMVNENEDEIIKTLLTQCSLLPEEFQNFCRMVVSQAGRQLIKFVKEQISNPRAVCQKLGACQSEKKVLPSFDDKCYKNCLYKRYSNIAMERFIKICKDNKQCYYKYVANDVSKCINHC
jgi:hypothetical protein